MKFLFNRFSGLTCALLLLLAANAAQAQLVPYYTFSQNTTTGVYVPITGGTVAGSGLGMDEDRFSVSIPFTFTYDNIGYNQLRICANGYLAFGAADPGTGQYFGINSSVTGFSSICGFSTNLASLNSTTELRYQTLGTAPNRTFVVQWKNFGYSGINSLTANFQIRLDEATNGISIVYGTMSMNGNVNAQIGLRGMDNTQYNSRSATTTWTGTTAGVATSTVYLTTSVFPASGLTFNYTPPPACAAPSGQPANLAFTPTYTTVSGSFSAAVPAANKYLVVRTPNVALNANPVNGSTYAAGNTIGNGTVVYAGSSTSFTSSGLTMATYYTYTIFAYNDLQCSGGPTYNTTNPLSANVLTAGPRAYTWVPSTGTASYALASNWSPARVNTDPNDTLYFNNGGTVTVTGVPTETVNLLVVSNNSSITINGAGTVNLTIGDSLSVAAGSSLTLSGANALTLKYITTFGSGTIDGTLSVDGSCSYDGSYASTVVTGIMNAGGGASVLNTCGCAPANFTFMGGSSYNHNRDGGSIPRAYYYPTATVTVTGSANNSPTIGTGQDFGNLVWNCPTQAVTITLGNTISTIKGNFTVTNTGQHTLQMGASGIDLTVNGNFTQTTGTVQLTGGKRLKVLGNSIFTDGILDISSSGVGGLTMNGNVTQGSTHLITKSSTSIPTILFSGTASQVVNIGGTISATVPINVTLNNPGGAVLTGTIPVYSGAVHTINTGSWTGAGSFSYNASNSGLVFNHTGAHAATAAEWPATNSPTSVTVNLTGAAPANQLLMPGSRTIATSLTMTQGVIVLGSSDLTVLGLFPSAIAISATTAGRMIATNGTGQLIRLISSGNNLTYLYPVGDITGVAEASPFTMTISNTAGRNIGVRVTNTIHPAETSTTDYMTRYWSFTDNGGSATYTYSAVFNYNAADITGTASMRLNAWNGTAWTPSLTLNSGTAFSTSGTYTSTANSLGGNDFTGRAVANTTYTWTGAASTDYMVAGNWSPVRTVHDPSDILLFNNGVNNIVTNVSTETITQLALSNNTTVNLKATAAATLSIYADNNAATDELSVPVGSALYLNGTTAALNLAFGGNATATIAGLLEIANTSVVNTINFTNCVATVTPAGELASGITQNNTAITSNAASLIVNGTFHHKFTTIGSGVPVATWGVGSNVLITEITTATTGPSMSGNGQVFYNVTYNCPNQTSAVNMSSRMPSTINGTLNVVSTGTGQWKWTVDLNVGYNVTIKKYLQTGGTVDLNGSSTNINNFEVYVTDSFRQTGGSFLSSSTAVGVPNVHFSGTGGRQYVSLYGTGPSGKIIYQVSNPAGISVTGTGTMPAFAINNGGGLRISTPVAYPVLSIIPLQYGATGTLTYDAAGSYSADTVAWPAIASPGNVTVAIGAGNILAAPFTRTIANALTLTSGDLSIGANSLTIGTSATSIGSLSNSAGNFIRSTAGSLTRWFGISALPTTSGLAGGSFPLAYNASSRAVSVYFSYATALTTGGTITLTHSHVPGLTTGLSVPDGSYTINSRTNASWNFTVGNGLTAVGTIGLNVTGADLFTTSNSANISLMKASSVVGTNTGSGGTPPNVYATRNNLNVPDLTTGSFYLGAASANISTAYVSVTTGSWKNGTTWNVGSPPVPGATVVISTGDTVTVDSSAVARMVSINANGTLRLQDSTLAVDSIITNYGFFRTLGGRLNLGPAGGGRSRLMNYGTLDVPAGTLNINGTLTVNAGATFNQSGGNINVDGYGGPGLVGPGIGFVEFISPTYNPCFLNLTGGNLTIVDPNPISLITYSYGYSFYSEATATFGTGHNLIFGNGTSTSGGNSLGFVYRAGNCTVGNIIVNGTPNTGNRQLWNENNMQVGGNITINNAGGEFDQYSSTVLSLNGNLTVNANAAFYAGGYQYFGGAGVATPNPQIVSGAGTFSSFGNLQLNNTSASGVTFGNDISVAGNIAFVHGNIQMGVNTLTHQSGVVSSAGQSSGWVVGKFKRQFLYNTAVNFSFPIGDNNYYTPVSVTGAVTSVTNSTGGYIAASTTTGDHPAIASSTVLASKSVNRYYSMETSGGITLSPYSLTLTPTWNAADVDPGANSANFIAANYLNNLWTQFPTASPLANSISIPGLSNNITGSYQIGEQNPSPAISLQPLPQSICNGASASFTVGTAAPSTYQWQVNTGSVWADVSNVNPYAGATATTLNITGATTAMNGYLYRCRVIGNPDTAYSATALLTVNPIVTPSVSVTAVPGSTVCAGSTVTFNAIVTGGGTAPSYQWKLNGVNVGVNSASYTSTTLANNDVITCVLTSNAPCATATTATSTGVTMIVNPPVVGSVSISANPGNSICTGTAVTFTAAPLNGGASPVYQWKKNGNNVGSNSATYTDLGLNNNDIITCVMTSNASCVSTAAVTSNAITMTVGTSLTPSITIAANPGTVICAGTSVAFTATPVAGGSAPSYQWKINGVNVGTNNAIFTSSTLANGNSITCVLTSNASCATTTTATSAALTMTVNPSTPASVSISASPGSTICIGASVTFTAVPVNGGSTPSYQWKKNGANVGTNSTSYIATGLLNGDAITCVLTSNAPCAGTSVVTSNAITMTVSTPVAPTAIVTTPNNPVCAGSSVVFTAATNVTGGTYQWQVNGTNAGTNAASYTYSPANGDAVICIITVPLSGCYTASSVTSVAVTMSVTPLTTPTLSISGSSTACSGTSVTYAAATNLTGGSYQWKVNGINAGTNAATYAYNPANGDVITCTINAAGGSCVTATTTTSSNSITMAVTASITPTVSITAGATSVCAGTQVAFTAAANITGSYQWKVNGVNAGINAATYAYTPANGDVVSCVLMTPTTGCFTAGTVTSSSINMTVTAPIAPTATINTGASSICAGTTATFTATANVTGASYQWKVNGANAGSNAATYAYAPASGDVVTCVVTAPPGGCYTSGSVTSNAVTMTVSPVVTPTITIAGPPTVTSGATVLLTATVTNAGNSYSIAWAKNGSVFATTPVPSASYTKGPGADNIVATITPSGGCFNTATSTAIVVGEKLAVGNVTATDPLLIYPNPFGEQLTISGLKKGDRITLFDLAGKRLYEWTSAPNGSTLSTFNVPNLPAGSYMIKIWDKSENIRQVTAVKKL